MSDSLHSSSHSSPHWHSCPLEEDAESATLTRFSFSGDDKFIQWLRECREAGMQVKGQNNLNISENASSIPKAWCNKMPQVNLSQVKAKVGDILASCGQQDVEKTCKWFLLWHNRYYHHFPPFGIISTSIFSYFSAISTSISFTSSLTVCVKMLYVMIQ